MKAKPVETHDGKPYGVSFHCPGCDDTHVLPTSPRPGGWDFNGDLEKPTLSPSILVYEVKKQDGSVYSPRCHSYVRDGQIQFLSDCGHALAGQTVDLPER